LTEPPFGRIAIVGFGLIGGSIALAAKRAWPSIAVQPIHAGEALDHARGADLVVLSAPVLANIRILQQLAPHLQSDTVVTDVGSTKRSIVRLADQLPVASFIGGHPMAGGARGGASHARADLFGGHTWILTPRANNPSKSLARLEAFVAGLGAVPHVMTAELHDRFVGVVSHLPQLTASALMHVVGKLAGDAGLELAGPGLRDTTRLASSPADIWRDIASTNADVLGEALDVLIHTLEQMRESLDTGEGVDAVFTSACRWRDALDRTRGRG
jgi:prephenate dehydrogenase